MLVSISLVLFGFHLEGMQIQGDYFATTWMNVRQVWHVSIIISCISIHSISSRVRCSPRHSQFISEDLNPTLRFNCPHLYSAHRKGRSPVQSLNPWNSEEENRLREANLKSNLHWNSLTATEKLFTEFCNRRWFHRDQILYKYNTTIAAISLLH